MHIYSVTWCAVSCFLSESRVTRCVHQNRSAGTLQSASIWVHSPRRSCCRFGETCGAYEFEPMEVQSLTLSFVLHMLLSLTSAISFRLVRLEYK